MINTPENQARQEIDKLLIAAGWIIQDYKELHLPAGKGIAVREHPLTTGPADYLLYVNREPVGIIEAKKDGTTLSGYEEQAKRYSEGLSAKLKGRAPFKPLPFLYVSTSNERWFVNLLDPVPRSRRVFAFHKPETIEEWVKQRNETLRWRLKNNYKPLIPDKLWTPQVQAINNLEQSLGEAKERALIQMATGSGKTFTAVTYIYRMLRDAKVNRVLFLVDRRNLGKQAEAEFKDYDTPDDGRKFTEIYNIQRMQSNVIDSGSKVVITTIQRLYSMLRGEAEIDPELEDESSFTRPYRPDERPREVAYNPTIPIEYFDVIIIDESHRSIYNLWRQVLEYFDAFLIGMTATPSKQTFGFFRENLVMEYTREQAVIDGVNVPGEVYTIRTQITEQGSVIEANFNVVRRDKKTREERMEILDDDLPYTAEELDRKALSMSQLRNVLATYKEKLPIDIFPDRSGDHVPKTLIFAKDDAHAEEIVRMARDVFNERDEFCQKITYKADRKPDDLIADFRTNYYPRIAVTVDMIATGTDVKAIEVLMFMRLVHSPGLFEQMQGRGVRVINPSDLKAVTGDADEKTRFIIVDAVGAIDIPKLEVSTMERKRSFTFKQLMNDIAMGIDDDDTLLTTANRLSRMTKKLSQSDRDAIHDASGGKSLTEIGHMLLAATNLDNHIEQARATTGEDNPPETAIQAAEKQMRQDAVDIFSPTLRNLLEEIRSRDEIYIDDFSIDEVLHAGFNEEATDRANQMVQSFQQFIEDNRDEITALSILYDMPYKTRKLEWAHITELANRLQAPPHRMTPDLLWAAYARVDPDKVKMGETKRLLTDLITLVRHALDPESELLPFPQLVKHRYDEWRAQQDAQGKVFTDQQQQWLDVIADEIGINLQVTIDDLDDGVMFDRGGIRAAIQVFGSPQTLRDLLNELNETLVA